MILIISNIANEAAATLAEMFPPGDAALITASNFNTSFRAGIVVSDFASSSFTVNNTAVSASEITGVVTTITNFFPQEFYYIQPGDREYVCAEMNAFFTYLLNELDCPKINPPTVRSFAGLSLYKTEWINTALALQIPVYPVYLKNGLQKVNEKISNASLYACTMIAGLVVGEEPPGEIKHYTAALQIAFKMPYLQCFYIKTAENGWCLADILSVPDISKALHREAIVDYFIKNSLHDTIMGHTGRRAYGHGVQRA